MQDLNKLYLRLFKNKTPKQEEKFKLGKCNFETDYEVNPLEYFQQNNFFQHAELENLHFLFSNLPIQSFDCQNRIMCKYDAVFEEIYFMVCMYDVYNWGCHQTAPYFSMHNPDWDYLLGFAHQRLSSGQIHASLHSFNAKGKKFVDPTLQARYQQQVYWVDKGIWGETAFKLNDFYHYIGIKLPTDLVAKIVFGNEDKNVIGNVWGYLLKNVLISREKTEEFIEKIKNY